MFANLWFWLAICGLAVVVGALSFGIALWSRDEEDTISVFIRAYPSVVALLVVLGSWFRWWNTDPTLQLGILLVNAILALSLAAFVADIKSGGIPPLLCALWMLICIVLAVVYLVLQAPITIQRVEREVGGPWFRWLMVGLVVAVGTVVHVFKRINQLWYGLTEIVFGAATMYRVAETWPRGETLATQWAAIIAAAYIIARGLNNCHGICLPGRIAA